VGTTVWPGGDWNIVGFALHASITVEPGGVLLLEAPPPLRLQLAETLPPGHWHGPGHGGLRQSLEERDGGDAKRGTAPS
jgi:hypothetical protein